jgi:hypothetical protein
MAYPRSAAVNRISSRARTRGNVIGAADGFYGGLELRGHCRWPAASTSALGRSLRRTLSSEFAAAAVNTTALPTDKTYANQEKAAKILQRVFAEQPNHPGAAHYLIHSYDSAPLADLGLPAAICYSDIAPAVPHALHMPSHIFTRVGQWQNSIASNRASAEGGTELRSRTRAMRARLRS